MECFHVTKRQTYDNMKLYGYDHMHKYPRLDVKSSFEKVRYLNLNSWHIPGQLF